MLSMELKRHGHFNWAASVEELEQRIKRADCDLAAAMESAQHVTKSLREAIERKDAILSSTDNELCELRSVIRDFIERAQPMTEQR